ncbi:MAG TPA: ATPase, T2SS/T4P/T4SS family [Candidatus Limnocylindrales bacterium]|nr:ATPase, T2SS/T4P/T4SS family [Candidatus Limnocylindrales bacterium]
MQEPGAAKEKIGRIFIKVGLIDEEKLQIALEENKKNPRELIGETLVRLNFVSEQDIAKALSYQNNVPYLDLASTVIEPMAIELIPLKLAREYQILPVRIENRELILAMKNPRDIEAIDMARFTSGLNIRPVVAAAGEIKEAINRHYSAGESINQIIQNVAQIEGIEFIRAEMVEEENILELKNKSEMGPIVKLVNSIIFQSVSERASDLHIEPQEKLIQVRHRVDGILNETLQIPKWVQSALISRIKLMAGMDIAEKRIPQDGRIKLRKDHQILDLRVSTLPVQYGEKVVIRILDKSKSALSITELGFSSEDLERVKELINLPQGMILVCGPTGSGKTTTLYALISEISRKKINIVTLEDPIEYEMNRVNQVQINEKAGLTFAKALRSILRQDPNVILVGEIRDRETAEIAMGASMTGHLVLSTLHTNDAVSTIVRLLDLGVAPYLIASSLSGIISQRLIRILCDRCREKYQPDLERLRKIRPRLDKEIPFYRGKGCEYCQQTGYRGRKGVHEILMINGEIRELISQRAPERKIREAALKGGMKSLIENALEKLKQGITTLEELERVVLFSEESRSLTELKCPSCQKVMEPDWKICPYCESKLKEAITPERNAPIKGLEKTVEPSIKDIRKDFKGFKILLVDDNEVLARGLASFLVKNQFIATAASNGKEALEIIAQNKPHLILTDIPMPEMDGLELIKTLRQDPTTAFIPVIVLSQKTAPEERLRAFELGADDYIFKPVLVEELLYRIKAVLRRTYP